MRVIDLSGRGYEQQRIGDVIRAFQNGDAGGPLILSKQFDHAARTILFQDGRLMADDRFQMFGRVIMKNVVAHLQLKVNVKAAERAATVGSEGRDVEESRTEIDVLLDPARRVEFGV